ncbi:hypothetical protein ACFE04_027004 [Oxalis oulophora]
MATTNTSFFDKEDMSKYCVTFPPRVNSVGIFINEKNDKFYVMDYALPRLELEILLIFVFGQAFHFILRRAETPIFVSHMIAGLIVGEVMSLMIPNNDGTNMMKSSEDNTIVMGSMAAFGYSFYMFLNGVKMNLSLIKKAGATSIIGGVLTVIIPLLILVCFNTFNVLRCHSSQSFFVASTYCLTSFPVIADLLRHLKIINTELGRLALSTAIVGDLLSLFLFIVNALIKIGLAVRNPLEDLASEIIIVASFIFVVVLVFRPAVYWIVRNTPVGRPVKEIYVYFVILTLMATTFLTKEFGQFLLFGPFVLGLVIPNGPPLGSALEEKLEPMISGMFLPLFVASTTTRIMPLRLGNLDTSDIDELLKKELVFLAMFASKFVVSAGFSLYNKMPKYDALALACIMSTKGIVELGWYGFLSDGKLMEFNLYMLLVFLIMGIAILVPILVRILYNPKRKYASYQKMSIMNSILNSELSIVACIHVPNNVNAIVNLLDVASPSKDSPISINVLHLVKLSAQSSPIFITHQLDRQALSSNQNSYSGNVILSFKQFEQNHYDGVSLNVFTAISPDDMMDEDICTLALDKHASFIIIPFHRRWYINGSIESDDHTIMALNWSVFERAPCSVGVLVDRGHIRRPTSTKSTENILMVFLGGVDDREALTFANRMAQDSRVKLTVLYIHTSTHNYVENLRSWERLLDFEVLKSVKDNVHVDYVEKEVNDGHVTATMLREMVNDYQLVIVGRRFGVDCPQTSGLKEWSEFPELGILGDLLASRDLYSMSSVLIVQQQIISENMR